MKKLLLSVFALAALTLAFGCESEKNHHSITTTDETSMPDLNAKTAPQVTVKTNTLNSTTTSDIKSPP
jgi:hypothetical protein